MNEQTLNTMFFMGKDYDRLIEAAKKLKKCETASEVARFLGITENGDQIMTNWKSSRSIPDLFFNFSNITLSQFNRRTSLRFLLCHILNKVFDIY